jgi:hypothetical protein
MVTNKTTADLEAEIEDLQEELDAAYSKLDNIAGIASGEENEDEDDSDHDEDEELVDCP